MINRRPGADWIDRGTWATGKGKSKRQKAKGKRQKAKAKGKRQKAKGKRLKRRLAFARIQLHDSPEIERLSKRTTLFDDQAIRRALDAVPVEASGSEGAFIDSVND